MKPPSYSQINTVFKFDVNFAVRCDVSIKDSWAHHFFQKAHQNAKWPIKILILYVNEFGDGPLAHF